jgi:acetyltransferase-like isoleucine patch superfamily enzyme
MRDAASGRLSRGEGSDPRVDGLREGLTNSEAPSTDEMASRSNLNHDRWILRLLPYQVTRALISARGRPVKRSLRQLLPWLLARFYLRNCDSVGSLVRAYGKPVIENAGTMVLGDRVRIVSKITPVELVTGPDGRLEIGNGVFINRGTTVSASQLVSIGDNCQIGPHSVIMDNDFHSTDDHLVLPTSKPVVIEPDVWLGTRVIVLKGVTIGSGSTVGAGSVVTKDIPRNSLAVGVPARVVRQLR